MCVMESGAAEHLMESERGLGVPQPGLSPCQAESQPVQGGGGQRPEHGQHRTSDLSYRAEAQGQHGQCGMTCIVHHSAQGAEDMWEERQRTELRR